MVVGLQALLPRLSLDLGSQVVALLQLLEAATGVGFCCHCCHPRPHCTCMGASQLAPPTSWSKIVQQAPGYGVTSSSGGVTGLSTSMGGMPGYVVPPPGLTPPDFSIWSIPPQEAPLPPELPVSPLYQPPMGRASSLRATIDRQAQALRHSGTPKDPLKHVAHYRSQGWRKDLDLIFKVYYKYNFSSFKESEWSKLRDKVLDHLLPCQEEWRSIKENDPLQYMPYMEEQFYATTRIRLKGLAKCTIWIKWGSYYHSVVAQKGQLHKCPHLVGIELPKGPKITPSESHRASQKKAEAPVASSSAPVIEASTPQRATSDVPAPMETGGAGDSQSWAEQTEAEDDFKRCRPTKCPQSQSRRWEDRPTLPFPLQDEEGRCTSTQELYRHAGQQPLAHHNVATMRITHLHLAVLLHEARSLGNQVLCMIAEYHLTSNAQGLSSLSLALPEVARDLLPPIEDYVGGGAFHGTRDVRVVERAKTL